MAHQVRSPSFWLGLICVVCILTVSAPFDTGEQFNNIQRFFYWFGISVSTFFTCIFILILVCKQLIKLGKSKVVARTLASVLSAFSVAVLVFFINAVVLGIDEIRWKTFIILGGNCFLISLAVSSIYFIITDNLRDISKRETDTHQPVIKNSAFFLRLPESLGTDLISLQSQDHYVEVKTTLGSKLILIRLSDAIRELELIEGLQVHRSWWVTHKHIVEQKRIRLMWKLYFQDNLSCNHDIFLNCQHINRLN